MRVRADPAPPMRWPNSRRTLSPRPARPDRARYSRWSGRQSRARASVRRLRQELTWARQAARGRPEASSATSTAPHSRWGRAAASISPRRAGTAAATAVDQSSCRLAQTARGVDSQSSHSGAESRGASRQAASSARASSSRPSMRATWWRTA